MSLFGATTTFKKAVARMKAEEEKKSKAESVGTEQSTSKSVSSGIGAQMIIAWGLEDPDGTATTSEIAREELGSYLGRDKEAVTSPREVFNEGVRIHNAEVRAAGHPSPVMEPILGSAPCEEYGVRKSQKHDVQTISSNDESSLSSPPPTTSYGGRDISFPSQTPVQRVSTPAPTTSYGGSVLAMPLSALLQNPFSTPRAGTGIIAQRYIQAGGKCQSTCGKRGGNGKDLESLHTHPEKI